LDVTFLVILTETYCTKEMGPGSVFCPWWNYKIYYWNVYVNLL